MKNIRLIFTIASSLAFGASYAQTSTFDVASNNDEKIARHAEANNVANCDANQCREPLHSNKPEIKIYPEPFLGIVSVNLSNCPDAKICLFDRKGNCLKYQNCQKEAYAVFNLKDQPKGIYYMEIMSQGEKTVKAIYMQ